MSVYARPCGSIACKKKHWYYRFRIRGVRYRGAIPEARTQYQAEQAETRVKNEIFDKKYGVVEKKAPILAEYIDKVFIPWALKHKRAHRDYKWRCEVLKEAFGSRRMDEITKQMVESFQTGRMEGKTFRGNIRAPKSVNMDVWMLSRIYNHANDNDLDLTNPCAKVEMLDVDNARTRYLSEDEEERLLAQCTGRRAHLRLPILIALHTGMRKQEILKLEWENIDFSRDLIYVRKTKTGRKGNRDLPMNEDLKRELLAYRPSLNASGRVFPFKEIKRAFRSACEDAEIPWGEFTPGGLIFHDLRHTCATRLGDAKATAEQIMTVLGHTDIRTAKRYTHVTDRGLREAMDSLSTQRGKVVKIRGRR